MRTLSVFDGQLLADAAGRGRTLFETVDWRIDLRWTRSRSFSNGNQVLWYEPA